MDSTGGQLLSPELPVWLLWPTSIVYPTSSVGTFLVHAVLPSYIKLHSTGLGIGKPGDFQRAIRLQWESMLSRSPAHRFFNPIGRRNSPNQRKSLGHICRTKELGVECPLADDQALVCPRSPRRRLSPSRLTIIMRTPNAGSSIPWL